jgi:hypothetical protein
MWLTSSSDSIYLNINFKIIIKYDFDLKEIKRKAEFGHIEGIHFVKELNQLYLIDRSQVRILIYDSDLNYKSEIDLSSYDFSWPISVHYINGEIFVGGYNEILLIRKDNSSTIQTDICQNIDPVHIYKQKFILVPCYYGKRVNILNLDLSQTGYHLNTSSGNTKRITSDGKRLYVSSIYPFRIDIFDALI